MEAEFRFFEADDGWRVGVAEDRQQAEVAEGAVGETLQAVANITSAKIATTTLKEASMRGDSTLSCRFVTRQRVS